ncbi:histidine ammonia-lyase [Acidithiobacillus thiooxidans]|uniref:histidine ammonia-lyase n=1 Tax=Acidithiobacillus thiooxidans TaxID=930 RepID=UPI00285E6BF7|nr:histidine ammonia-lyase [Acidithiobacillus thiooxidans]MDR7925783.1 histidine ammonia-lyase [Acidithiobacillus thiooxidans]
MKTLEISPGLLTLDQLYNVFNGEYERFALQVGCGEAIKASAEIVSKAASGGVPVYGVNTGFGKLASTPIEREAVAQLQVNLVRSHCVGVGSPLAPSTTRLMMILKVASLARGYSGVRPLVIDSLLSLLNANLIPYIPSQGSVGASGDLAPLAHMTLCLMGEGPFLSEGQKSAKLEHLNFYKIEPLRLVAKEGLALINGTQTSTALALDALFAFQPVFEAALLIGAMSLEAARGSDAPFDDRIHQVRGQLGQIETAIHYREILSGSAIRASHLTEDDRVQDPYSLRCQPQVMGACLDQFRYASTVLQRETNAVTDNPLVFSEDDAILSGGNFHAEPVALVADAMAVAMSEVGAIAERRIAMLIDSSISRLPPFLTSSAGLNSGYMIAHVTAAALASENKSLAHPASVDSLPTSANQEDHVSMATFAARRLQQIVTNVSHILAIEYLISAQGFDYLRPLRSSDVLECAYSLLREKVPSMNEDRVISNDIQSAVELIQRGQLAKIAQDYGHRISLWG